MKKSLRLRNDCILFSIGGAGYALLEILWRRKTHWSMAVTGGTAFVSPFRFYKRFSKMNMLQKCISGSAIITALEYCCGRVVNLKFRLNVWDYSNCRLNLKGRFVRFTAPCGHFFVSPSAHYALLSAKKYSKKTGAVRKNTAPVMFYLFRLFVLAFFIGFVFFGSVVFLDNNP